MGRWSREPKASRPEDLGAGFSRLNASAAAAKSAGSGASAIFCRVVRSMSRKLPRSSGLQKAMAICQEAKHLASQLLSTIEKDDAEALALMRARHEREMLELGEAVRYGQVQEATKQLEALQRVQNQAEQRVRLGLQLFKAAEAHTMGQKEIIDELKAEREKFRDELSEDVTGLNARQQRLASQAIKRARFLGLLPFTSATL